MGDVYASAQLTIIASVGTDPSHGLPGVTHARDPIPTLNYARSGDLTLMNTPKSGINHIETSVWASRAWTFQECFLSRRRLFFTEEQMVYICQETVATDERRVFGLNFDRRKLGHIQKMLPFPEDIEAPRLTAGESIIESYSARKLSFESDALDAITGALRTLSYTKRPTRNVCGVVCRRSGGQDNFDIALNWFHEHPCSRRESFPSWTPLGWTGRVSHEWFRPQFPRDCSIRVGPDADSLLDLATWLDQYPPHATQHTVPSHLEITAPVLSFDSDNISIMSPGPSWRDWKEEELCVRVCVGGGLNMYTKPFWDTCSLEKDIRGLTGIIICNRTSDSPVRDWDYLILVLRPKGAFYERIGFLRWFGHPGSAWNLRLKSHDGKILRSEECKQEFSRVTNGLVAMMRAAETKPIILV